MKTVSTIFFMFAFALMASSAFAQKEEMTANGQLQPGQLASAVSVYPNPAIEYVHVRFDEPIAKQTRITLHNIIGNVLEVESEMLDDHELRLRVKDLPVGYYLLAVRDEASNSRSTIKFLKR